MGSPDGTAAAASQLFPTFCHGLFHNGDLVAVTTASGLIRHRVGGVPPELKDVLTRAATIELSRLCAARPTLNRAMLRLWRDCVLPSLPCQFAISYQDAFLHSGATYRNDGWQRVGYSHSGTDKRSGRKGRNKWVWLWPHQHLAELPASPADNPPEIRSIP